MADGIKYRKSDSGTDFEFVEGDSTVHAPYVCSYVWDSTAGAWAKMEQPTLEATDSNFYVKIDGVEDKLDLLRPPTGTGDNGTVTLGDGTATQVPDAGNVPASAYILVLSNQTANDMEWGYKTDDNTGGILLKKTSGTAAIPLGASQSVEVWGTLNDVVNWTTKII